MPERKGVQRATSEPAEAQSVIASQVPENRRDEIFQYLRLFGYRPERTILQVFIPGFFRKRNQSHRMAQKRQAAYRRYGGTTFVIVGRTHDPSIMAKVHSPRKSREQANPGYVGYLWKGSSDGVFPHDALPLDFTPAQFCYPADWKQMYGTRGFVIAMHVPASFASKKNALTRALYREGKMEDPKAKWVFLERTRKFGFEVMQEGSPSMSRDNTAA